MASLLNDYFCTVFNRVNKEDEPNIMIESRKQEDVLDSINILDEDVKKQFQNSRPTNLQV